MGHLLVWIGLTLLAYGSYKLKKRFVIEEKINQREIERQSELGYIERKGL